MISAHPPVLVTGGAGFIGCNLADKLAGEGENVLVFDSLRRPGVSANLAWLRARHPRRISAAIADVRDATAVADAARVAVAVFHFAAQVAVTSSIVDPLDDFQVNLCGTVNLLEALRGRRIPVIFASTNKVYGELDGIELVKAARGWFPRNRSLARDGINEEQRLDLRTPYGCSKGAADQYILDYARQFGVPGVVMRMSCIYGPRQLGTEDQGWVAHFLLRAIAGEPITIYGDGHQIRDVLHVDDAVRTYIAAWRNIGRIAGQAFNLGGGPANAVSLIELIQDVAGLLGHEVPVSFAEWRPNDQRWFVADPRRVRAALGLPAPMDWRAGVSALLRLFLSSREMKRAIPA
ncbi:MAG: NAD-dependent epimerase/dehydratase family protein [Acetobacteraceae bacterium]|nr:NAD-dependent epimerase/dehydratase family protein [Acetobacteraceae bacterium]